MPQDQSDSDYVVIPGLENSQPVTFTPMQLVIKPYVPAFEIFWWCVWASVLTYVATAYVLRPLLMKK